MRKTLLAGIAALSLLYAGTAHADDDKLPKDDPVLGSWCLASGNSYARKNTKDCGPDSYMTIFQDHYTGHEIGCSFNDLERLPNHDGWSASVECSGEGSYWNEEIEFWIADKMLRFRTISVTEAVSSQNGTYCAVVSTGITDGFLNLRVGPGTEYSVKIKLAPGERLEVDATTDDGWNHVWASRGRKATGGWIRGKYIREFKCPGDTRARAAKAEPTTCDTSFFSSDVAVIDKSCQSKSGEIRPEDIIRYNPADTSVSAPSPMSEENREDWCRRNNWDGTAVSCKGIENKKPWPKWLME